MSDKPTQPTELCRTCGKPLYGPAGVCSAIHSPPLLSAPPPQTQPTACPIATAVAADVMARAERGLAKYGVTLAREDLALEDWLQHAYEEALDQAAYLKRAIVLIRATKKAAPGDAA